MTKEARQAADLLAGEEISAEVIDLRSLVPLDRGCYRGIGGEDRSGGRDPRGPPHSWLWGRDRRGRSRSDAFIALAAPIQRVTGWDTVFPLKRSEHHYLPSVDRSSAAVRTHSGGLMANEFRLPDIGEGLTEAEIVRWMIPVGGVVKVDQPVVEVETDKAVVEIPSPYAGIVLHHGGAEGQTLACRQRPHGDRRGRRILASGSSTTADSETEAWLDQVDEEMATDEGMPEAPKDQAAPIVGSISDEAEQLGTGRRKGKTEKALGSVRSPTPRPEAGQGPRCRLIQGVRLRGRWPDHPRRRDCRGREKRRHGRAARSAPGLPPLPVDRKGERKPLSKLRRTIASNMTKSWSEIPHVTTFDEVRLPGSWRRAKRSKPATESKSRWKP